MSTEQKIIKLLKTVSQYFTCSTSIGCESKDFEILDKYHPFTKTHTHIIFDCKNKNPEMHHFLLGETSSSFISYFLICSLKKIAQFMRETLDNYRHACFCLYIYFRQLHMPSIIIRSVLVLDPKLVFCLHNRFPILLIIQYLNFDPIFQN